MTKGLLLVFFFLSSTLYSKDTTLNYLYKQMDNKSIYIGEKENRITEIRKMLDTPIMSDAQYYEINLKLYNEYKTYILDSAIHYARKNVTIATQLQEASKIYEANLDLASLYTVTGIYLEAVAILDSFSPQNLSKELLVKYYDCKKQLYNFYSFNNPYSESYVKQSRLYRDSLLSVLEKNSNHYKIVYAEKLYDEVRLLEAKQLLKEMLIKIGSDTHEKAVLAYALANVYRKEENILLQKHYYAVSSICDIKNAIKENASMQALAIVLFETGEIEKAYICIKSSMEDAIFCNARLRTYEVSQIFPIIDSAYQENIDKQKAELLFFLMAVSLLSIFLIVAIVYVYVQMKRVSRIRRELHSANIRLNELNTSLQSTIEQLNEVNSQLSEANQIKETYIAHFLDLCSTYIDKLDKYRNTLNKKALDRKLDDLYKILKSSDMVDNELKELFESFDNIFLHLFPNFVEEFNSLLLEEERFVLKPNEILNVELRIFALIRLGITDSSRIAKFLRYSANTIYSYRTRVRNKAAVPREKFESMVMTIGVINNK